MLNTNQKAKPKQNKKPKQNEGKIANKKLKKTRIGGGGVVSQQDLETDLKTMLTSLKGSYSVSFVDILKNTNNKKLLIEAIQKYENAGYNQQYKDAIMRAVKDGLVLLLKNNTSSTEQDKEASPDVISPEEISLGGIKLSLPDENATEPDASPGYEKFKSLVEVFTENIVNLKPPFTNKEKNPKDIKFKEHIYRIYTDGIVLLNITDTQSAVANVYKTDKNMIEYKTLDNVADFLMKSENCLIIVNRTETNDNYVYDCMLQILSKLVKILLESDNLQIYINRYLNNEDASPVSSEKQEIITAKVSAKDSDEVLNELIQAIYKNLKDEEIIDTYTTEKHRVLLRSLIFIRYGVPKKINETTFKIVKDAYMKQFEKNKELADILRNFEYSYVVDNIPDDFAVNCTSNSMKESFQHILNAMSSSSSPNNILEKNKQILIKSSKGFFSDCARTINIIIKAKSYLLSEPIIMSGDIKRNYFSKIKGKVGKNINTDILSVMESLKNYLIEFRNKIAAIIRTVGDENTIKALIKIYTDLKAKITQNNIALQGSFEDNIEAYSKKINTNGTANT